ncbi:MAG: 4a-hydroxytetrahydrobiopterin dehydratase [Elainellaceae cyanobacterium]
MKFLLAIALLLSVTLLGSPTAQSIPRNQLKEAPARLSESEITARMMVLPNWTTDGQTLSQTRTFADFVEAIAFVNSLVEPSEALGHHPDITISYNRVMLELTTHDAGGLTALDFQLAEQISQL